MGKKIITISREYGSGGRQVGLTVAKKLGMEFYDKELIDAAAKEIGFPTEMIADREQRLTNSLLYNFAMGTLYGIAYPREPKITELPLTEQIFQAQKKAIEEYGEIEEYIDEFMYQTDKRRRIHYENYTNQKWGSRENYDLMLNSGDLGIEKCVDLLCEAVK